MVSMDLFQIISLALIIVLLLCSALISGAEVALFSMTPTDFETNGKQAIQKRLEIVERLLERPKRLLATILVSNNFINVAIILLFDSVSSALFGNVSSDFYGISVRFILEVGVVTFLILLFGEILPKVYANRNRVNFAVFMAIQFMF